MVQPPGRKDVEGPPRLLASCMDPMNKVTTFKQKENKPISWLRKIYYTLE